MGGLWIKVIAGAIEVYGKEEYGVEAILLTVGLGLDEHHFLR